MRLGIGLPNSLPFGLDRRLFLDWARLADRAGFHGLGTLDRPNYDMWDPMTALAAAAAVTEDTRLATCIMQLPIRNEVLVAKQAAVIDNVSNGRMVLGVGLGGRADDYEVYGASMEHRVSTFRAQIDRIRGAWSSAAAATAEQGMLGPAPVQRPGPPIWLGGSHENARRRAVELGDGYIFSASFPPADLTAAAAELRDRARDRGREGFTLNAIAYVAVGGAAELREAVRQTERYYPALAKPAEELVHHGPPQAIAETAAVFAEAGLDSLYLLPQVPDLAQVEALAEHVLPAYRD